MFKDNLVVALKANGKILREVDGKTILPFGQEYSILIKNMDSKRAKVKVWIDGTDATEDTELVVYGNSEITLERFIKNGNLKEGNKLKFIEKTQKISDHRGDKIDDGFIRIEWQFEKVIVNNFINTIHNDYYYRGGCCPSPSPIWLTNGGYYGSGYTETFGVASNMTTTTLSSNSTGDFVKAAVASAVDGDSTVRAFTAQATAQAATATVNQVQATENTEGITVPGSHSDQTFTVASWFNVEDVKHTIVLKLQGENAQGQKVEKPVTVKTKQICDTCGRTNKATSKFCSECGTSLQLF
jgi:hypothetical protein